MPLNRLSTEPVYAPYRSPDTLDLPNRLTDFELGGVALQDASQGLQVQRWTCRAESETGIVYLGAENVPEIPLFTADGITDLSLAFDQNMRPFVAFTQLNQAKFRWYDTVLGANRITELDPNDRTPRCCMDDKRPWQVSQGANDVILAYLRGDSLYYRQQRERYEVERFLASGLEGKRLIKVGMNIAWRLQFEFV